MKIELWMVGKTSFPYLKEGIEIYQKRLKHYLPFAIEVIPDLKNTKNLNETQVKNKEAELILKKLAPQDFLILLDENGKQYDSIAFAKLIESKRSLSHKKIVFLIGGAYGFSDTVYQRSNAKISLSKMTFSHQMVRLFVVEQIYRAMTILKNEPYHHV